MDFGALFKGFQVLSFASSWSQQALLDGKVTAKEALGLAEGICGIIGVKLEIDVADLSKED